MIPVHHGLPLLYEKRKQQCPSNDDTIPVPSPFPALVPPPDHGYIDRFQSQYLPGPEDTVIETGQYTRDPGGERVQERETARELYHRSMDTAVSFFHRAKAAHDELESYYIPNMNFGDIDRLRHQIIKKISSYAHGGEQ